MNACAVVRASPAARCGRWTGSPSASASAPSESHGRRGRRGGGATGARACSCRRPGPREARCAAPAEERALDPAACATSTRPDIASSSASAACSRRRRAGEVELAQAVDPDRLRRHLARRAHEALARAGEHDAAAVDRHARPGEDRVARAGRGPVVSRSTTQNAASRHGVLRALASPHPRGAESFAGIRRWTAGDGAEGLLQGVRRAAVLSVAGIEEVVGLDRPPRAARPGAPSRSPAISSWASSSSRASVGSSVPASAAARSRGRGRAHA